MTADALRFLATTASQLFGEIRPLVPRRADADQIGRYIGQIVAVAETEPLVALRLVGFVHGWLWGLGFATSGELQELVDAANEQFP